MREQRPLIGISMGDPAGIGPEVTVRSLLLEEIYELCRPLVVGDLDVISEAVTFSGLSLRTRAVRDPAAGAYEHGTVDVLDLDNVDVDRLEYGKVSAAGGRACFQYIAKVIELAMADRLAATTTGPIHKEALRAADIHYPGHTEIYADLTGTQDFAMMLADGEFRVVHVSTHVALREACDLVTEERVYKVIRLGDRALRRLGIAAPRIAVCGLNPHCGEGGLFGNEEADQIAPAVERAREEGLDVDGPIPPDTVFPKMKGGLYDLVVAMYHDQGHIATKLLGFTYEAESDTWLSVSGVNVTLGLPIIRTSV
ncbi:MAG: 4-hydroxythreonine-4-phosphate dehydrogenase PdxA, partial [Candidatus Brocadiia bacterium]